MEGMRGIVWKDQSSFLSFLIPSHPHIPFCIGFSVTQGSQVTHSPCGVRLSAQMYQYSPS
jgi:hypothetical protein